MQLGGCLLITILALSGPARNVVAQPTTTAPSIDAELAEIDAEIYRLIHTADEAGTKPVESMLEDAKHFQALAARIETYLRDRADDENRDRLTLSRWEAIYLSATIRGESLDQIASELNVALAPNASAGLKDAVKYWRLRIELNRLRSEEAQGRSNRNEVVLLKRSYLIENPSSTYAVALAVDIVEGLYAAGDISGAEACIELLEKHHPRNVVTKTLAGRHRLRRTMGQVWRPVLAGLDGRPLDWPLSSDAPTMVIFWSPTHGPSGRMLQLAQGFQQKAGMEKFHVVTIALHKSGDAISRELTRLGVAYPTALEQKGWQSSLAEQYGIRTLPTVLMLDREGRLRAIFEPVGWDMRADFERAAAAFLGIPASQPATSQEADRPPTSLPVESVIPRR